MIVHLHSQHNMICTCFKYPCGKLCRMLIDEYLSPSNMYLVTSPHHNNSVRSTPENRLMALELVTGQTSNQLSSFNRNIIQICLYLEGIGTFAKVRLFCMILKKYFRILKCSRVKKAALSCTLRRVLWRFLGTDLYLSFLCTLLMFYCSNSFAYF